MQLTYLQTPCQCPSQLHNYLRHMRQIATIPQTCPTYHKTLDSRRHFRLDAAIYNPNRAPQAKPISRKAWSLAENRRQFNSPIGLSESPTDSHAEGVSKAPIRLQAMRNKGFPAIPGASPRSPRVLADEKAAPRQPMTASGGSHRISVSIGKNSPMAGRPQAKLRTSDANFSLGYSLGAISSGYSCNIVAPSWRHAWH